MAGTDLPSDLVATGPTDRDPAFDPTGTRLAFTSTRTGNEEIWVAAADGSGPANVSRHPARANDPAWSPDGRIAFTSTRAGAPHVFVTDAAGGGVRQLTDGEGTDQQPSWSPAGTEIVFASDRGRTTQLYPASATPPRAAVAFTRALVRCGLSSDSPLRAYFVGHAGLLRA